LQIQYIDPDYKHDETDFIYIYKYKIKQKMGNSKTTSLFLSTGSGWFGSRSR